MPLSLYEIGQDVLEAINNLQVNEETGEIMNFDALEALQGQFDVKAENIACYIKNLTAEAEAIRNEEKALYERRKSATNKAERLEKYLSDTMLLLGKDKVKTPRAEIGFRKSASVKIDDGFLGWAAVNAMDFLKFKEPEIDKAAVKKAIQTGKEFEFARLEEKQNIQIR